MIRSPLRFVLLAGLLFGAWLLLSGIYSIPRLLITGGVVSLLVAWMMDRVRLLDEESLPVEVLAGGVLYSLWLALEIVKSSLNVTRIILTPSLPISPTFIIFRPGQKTDLGRVVHGNSITLTPGTITTGISSLNNEIEVHAIEKSGALGCVGSKMDDKVSRFEAPLVRESV